MRLVLPLAALLLAGCLGQPSPSATTPQQALAWTTLAPAPTPRTEVGAGAVGTTIYIAGGFDAGGNNVRTVEAYDTERDRWTAASDYPIPAHHVAFASDGTALYAFGGFTTAEFIPTNLAFKFAPALGWQPLPPLPQARAAGAAALLDGKVYLFGGFGAPPLGLGVAPGQLLSRVDVFDLAAQSWSQGPDLPTPRDHLAGAALGGRVYAVSGELGGHDKNVATVEVLDPATGWTKGADLPRPRGSLGAAVVGDRLLAVGGQDPKGTFHDADAYDSARGAWSALPPLPTARHGLGVVAVRDTLYVLEGGPDPGQSTTAVVEALARPR